MTDYETKLGVDWDTQITHFMDEVGVEGIMKQARKAHVKATREHVEQFMSREKALRGGQDDPWASKEDPESYPEVPKWYSDIQTVFNSMWNKESSVRLGQVRRY